MEDCNTFRGNYHQILLHYSIHMSSHSSNTSVLLWLYRRVHQRTIAKSLFLVLFFFWCQWCSVLLYILEYFASAFSLQAPYVGCLCKRAPPSSAWRTADKKAMKSSGPKLHWHRHSEEGMFRSSLPDEPEMLSGLIFNSLSNQNPLATSARWALVVRSRFLSLDRLKIDWKCFRLGASLILRVSIPKSSVETSHVHAGPFGDLRMAVLLPFSICCPFSHREGYLYSADFAALLFSI